jgi:AraC family transcriptional regulator, positive regulator of tynA and feaB
MSYPTEDLTHAPELDYEAFRDALRVDWGRYSPRDFEANSFAGRVRRRTLLGFDAIDLTCNAHRIERVKQDIRRDDMDHYYAAVPVAGASMIVQNDTVIEVGTGDVVLIDSATPATFTAAAGCQYVQWLCLKLPRQSFIAQLGFEPRMGACGRRRTQAARLLHQLVLEPFDDAAATTVPADGYMHLAVYDLLGALFVPSDPSPASRQADKLYVRVCDTIKNRFADPDLTPHEVAAETGISLRYLQKLFTLHGTTFVQYTSSLRLGQAARLIERRALLKTSQPLSEIAYACGFRDYTHFARGFRRRFGQTPGSVGAGGIDEERRPGESLDP